MRVGKAFALVLGLLWTVAAAATDADGKPDPAVHHRPAKPSPAALQQRVDKHQAEVQRLQQDVSQQEQASRQASEHLQQQDQTIAELQKQLQEVHAKPSAGGH